MTRFPNSAALDNIDSLVPQQAASERRGGLPLRVLAVTWNMGNSPQGEESAAALLSPAATSDCDLLIVGTQEGVQLGKWQAQLVQLLQRDSLDLVAAESLGQIHVAVFARTVRGITKKKSARGRILM
jgi:hypothetical protein